MKSIHDERYRQLITNLILLREQKGVTQTELALALRKPQSYVAKIENFDRRLDIVELVDWLKALEVEIVVFLANQTWINC